MTIPYEGSFLKAVFRWHGSVWKAIWRELLVWLLFYYGLRTLIVYYPFTRTERKTLNEIVKQFGDYTRSIPVEFLLGFYVTQTVGRWWSQIMLISSPHEVMGTIAAYINEVDEESQRIRHIIARYLILYSSMAYRNISSKIRQLFPTNDCYLEIGLMTQEEKEILDKAPKGIAHELTYQWIIELVHQKVGNRKVIINALNVHRSNMKQLSKYNDFALPLVYTQTVTIIVYGYFTMALIGHQFLIQDPALNVDLCFPFFTVLRFIFGVGWLKVAEDLSKPFGNDDDDVDLCKCLSSFCDNVFTIATLAVNCRPSNSWKNDDVKYDKFKATFQNGITKYEHIGKKISRNFKKHLLHRQVNPV